MLDRPEDRFVEQPAIHLFAALGWQTFNAFSDRAGKGSWLRRETTAEVVLLPALMSALRRLNPALPDFALKLAADELRRDRSALHPVEANREVHLLLKNGVKVAFRDHDEGERVETVRVIDWDEPDNNSYTLVSQLWVSGDIYKRRTDLVGFVNGLPLLFVELKASHKRVRDAYEHNLRDYKVAIPQLFWYNAFIILSNASQTCLGTISSPWEQFAEWKKIDDEHEPGLVSLETAIRGACPPARLLDIVENFIVFSEARGGRAKLLARYHQYLGVNNALARVREIRENQGRLGVFWHTQGSGKSLSMLFFAQKVLRKLPGAWTFVVVTDRQELDEQIYKTFAAAGAITEGEDEVHAGSADHLRRLLREDHRYVFTLIQKFRTTRGEQHPLVSDRSDIIVITDEAHRTQYDVLALNMRNALPHAAFIGFTGTPLMAGEQQTREVFGDYVSVYNFKQSVDDAATVPLYYENRIPELQLKNDDLNEQLDELIEQADLDEAQQAKLEREFQRQYHLITRDERLDRIAADIVDHFLGHAAGGKAMVVSIDKATAVRMYDKAAKGMLAASFGRKSASFQLILCSTYKVPSR